jgi:hypothetical protein
MVNSGFLDAFGYGFESVDGLPTPWNRHQSKIYAESNQADFSRIFRDLTSKQTLAIYRRLLGIEKTAEQERQPE